ncbi:hypothetical protein D0469_05970 [Peribacillus saganii]|uniref:Uncharacterized protein n=1 Tax=Peribacillus saganii TaxID=2303992 RepID=A0A372LQJ5_9BACI|nr:hypothetical protein [Peribacillus saganii]RFU70478.1 hypothetical protein D0469_05970 [Peribacillus saganii]
MKTHDKFAHHLGRLNFYYQKMKQASDMHTYYHYVKKLRKHWVKGYENWELMGMPFLQFNPFTQMNPHLEFNPETEIETKFEFNPQTQINPNFEFNPMTQINPKTQINPELEINPKTQINPKAYLNFDPDLNINIGNNNSREEATTAE